ncbi:glutamyl-tRNA reductase [Leucobacter sp. W1478]|uniref:glutamyl-tRNA reductase n=1 Tax=Leucobacter sp. W1478 TaxID=3439065 RepID=UPI003F345CEA
MVLVCLSLDHHRIDFDLLGAIEHHTQPLAEALSDPTISTGSVVLATCNRFEAYLDVPSSDRVDLTLSRIAAITGVDSQKLRSLARVHTDLDAAEHLFSVAGGLESVVVGEGEIAGQVRRSLEQARGAGSTTSELERLFQFAARTSRDIKHRTGVQTAGRSLVRLALAMAQSRIGDWSTSRILLVGTGMYAGASLAALRARGATDVAVYSPSGRAEQFARSHEIRAIQGSELEAAVAEADLIITTSLAKEPILPLELFEKTQRLARGPYCGTLRGRPYTSTIVQPRLVIDLGVPRNVDPEVVRLPGVELLDLELIAKHAPIEELSAEAEAREIVQEAVNEYAALRAEYDAVPALVALREHVHAILNDEIQRAKSSACSAAESCPSAPGHPASVEAALRHFAGRLLHAPSLRVRELGRVGEAERAYSAIESLFGLTAVPEHA